ncbi:hypothetical protein [Streptomyces sp. NPDC055109]
MLVATNDLIILGSASSSATTSGPGPNTITPTPFTGREVEGPAPRLLPAERIDEARLPDDTEDQAGGDGKGRRTLGPGTPPA